MGVIDARLDRVVVSADSDANGTLDRADYMAGIGFAALQTYQACVIGRADVSKRSALSKGPVHTSGRTVASLIDAAANYWKHRAEWSESSPSSRAKQTIEALESIHVDPWREYALANALFAMVAPHPHRFESLVPFVERWRDSLN